MANELSQMLALFQKPLTWAKEAPIRTTSAFGICMFWVSIANNIAGLQQSYCQIPIMGRPLCGVLSWQGVAGPQEQKLWDSVSNEQTCDGYRQYIREYEKGEFVLAANARLNAARRSEEISFKPQDMPLPLAYPIGMSNGANEETAKAAAIESAKKDFGKVQCTGFDGGEFELKGFDIAPETWDCTPNGNGVSCGFSGKVVCHTNAKFVKVSEDCSSEKPAN